MSFRIFSALSLLCLAAGASQAGIIAQYDSLADFGSVTSWIFYPGFETIGQSFIPTADGTVISVDTYLAKVYPSSDPIHFQITTMSGDLPNFSNVLSTGTLSASDPLLDDNLVNWVGTSMTPATLHAGTSYALLVTAAGDGNYTWITKIGGNGYPSGTMLAGHIGYASFSAYRNRDLPFRINAADPTPPEAPEPATLSGLAIGLVALGALKRRFAQK